MHLNYTASNATSYALQYALTPNSSYADFTNYGGDCTNFISQCLYAGGKSMHYGTAYSGNCWYYTTSTNRSSTWTGASQFRNYVLSSNSQLNMSTSSWSSVVNGDIIQLLSSGSAYHSLIITGIAYGTYVRSDLLVCAHTTNRRHVSLQAYYSGTKAYYHVN
ncbi:MAG: amidase domain-containing protein [Lachnospiraceae bacterium]|nr:amidase domain-containing protein [Lachnospiraceae bacterium]